VTKVRMAGRRAALVYDLWHLPDRRYESTVRSMDTRSRKKNSPRSRTDRSGSCWYGWLVRSLSPCACSSNREHRRKSH
jgi:hypothetical protein